MDRPFGMHPVAFKGWIQACFDAQVSPDRITQTIGNARASKGTHARDGTTMDGSRVVDYCAAFDVSTRRLSIVTIEALLSQCYKNDIIGWYRRPPTWNGTRHMHLIYVACPMKRALRNQVHDWFHGRNGLASDLPEEPAPVSNATIERLRSQFLVFNPVLG